jgi:5-methylcytosine-specific restriction endonuclease McrA
MPDKRTLLINQGYEPIAVITWQRAICLVFTGKAEVIEEGTRVIRSAKSTMPFPLVVRLLYRYRGKRHRIRYSKRNIFARDRWRCQYCGEKLPIARLTIDHVVPRAKGGVTCWENVVTCCEPCNRHKADKTVKQARMSLLSEPSKPGWVPLFSLKIVEGNTPKVWSNYAYH